MKKTKIGIVGCGNISGIYFKNGQMLEILEVAACADLLPERAAAKAEEFNIPKACTVEELLADPAIDIASVPPPIRSSAAASRPAASSSTTAGSANPWPPPPS